MNQTSGPRLRHRCAGTRPSPSSADHTTSGCQVHCQVEPVKKVAVLVENHDEALQGGEVYLPQFEDIVFTELVLERL